MSEHTKVKIFGEYNDDALEQKINDFLNKNDSKVKRVVDIKFTSVIWEGGTAHSAMIMYVEK